MSETAVRILSLTGGGRSGSTILGNILGQAQGFFHAGELCYLWDRGARQNAMCGCGVPFSQCRVWHPVMAATPPIEQAELQQLARFPRSANRHLPLVMISRSLTPRSLGMKRYAARLQGLYEAIREVTGCDIIVDSSKAPSHVYVLGQMKGIDLRLVHLVRDPRAVAYSWHRVRARLDVSTDAPKEMVRTSTSRGAMKWAYSNGLIDVASLAIPRERVMRVRYEDVVRDPHQAMARIAKFAGAPEARLPFISDHEIDLAATHTVWGNPNRLKTGVVNVRPDDEWLTHMRQVDRLLVTGLTWPLLARYGYPARTGRQP